MSTETSVPVKKMVVLYPEYRGWSMSVDRDQPKIVFREGEVGMEVEKPTGILCVVLPAELMDVWTDLTLKGIRMGIGMSGQMGGTRAGSNTVGGWSASFHGLAPPCYGLLDEDESYGMLLGRPPFFGGGIKKLLQKVRVTEEEWSIFRGRSCLYGQVTNHLPIGCGFKPGKLAIEFFHQMFTELLRAVPDSSYDVDGSYNVWASFISRRESNGGWGIMTEDGGCNWKVLVGMDPLCVRIRDLLDRGELRSLGNPITSYDLDVHCRPPEFQPAGDEDNDPLANALGVLSRDTDPNVTVPSLRCGPQMEDTGVLQLESIITGWDVMLEFSGLELKRLVSGSESAKESTRRNAALRRIRKDLLKQFCGDGIRMDEDG